MNKYKASYIILIWFTLLATMVYGQTNLSKYIKLDVQQYEEDKEKYIGVSPMIKSNLTDKNDSLLNKYPRRFNYLLQNKTRFQGIYDHLYPDTNRINILYIDSISQDKSFVKYFNDLRRPSNSFVRNKLKFTKSELMKVASKFFYCDGVRPDSTISSHICIALNGVSEAKWDKDYTLLEAFCFEAIFENYYIKNNIRNQFVNNFVKYIKEGEEKEKSSIANRTIFLQKVRAYSFSKMEMDTDLQKVLLLYYNKVKQTLPFAIN